MVSQSIVKALLIAEQKFQHVMIAKYNKLMSRIVNPRTVDPIVEFVDPPVYGTLEPSFRDFMVPGMILAITYILAVGLTALTFVIERKGGQLERTVVAGVKIYQILFAQLIIQLVILCLQTFLVMTVTFLIFKIHNNGSYIMIVLITLMQGLAGMSFGERKLLQINSIKAFKNELFFFLND
jgi:ABC-type multidrug transport system permease subunit